MLTAFLVPSKDLAVHKRVQLIGTSSRSNAKGTRGGPAPLGRTPSQPSSCRSFVCIDPLATTADPLPPPDGLSHGMSERWANNGRRLSSASGGSDRNGGRAGAVAEQSGLGGGKASTSTQSAKQGSSLAPRPSKV